MKGVPRAPASSCTARLGSAAEATVGRVGSAAALGAFALYRLAGSI